MKHYICTAGTSILGANARQAKEGMVNELLKERIDQIAKTSDFLNKLSAETNSLLALGISREDRVTFLVTDTQIGIECAKQLVGIVIGKFNCAADYEVIKGLQVHDAKEFRQKGISNLYETIGNLLERYPVKTILNVTGGFKSVVPYTALYGLLHRLDLAYLFEFSNELIMLPPAPVGVNYEKAGLVRGLLLRLREEALIPLEDYKSAIEKTPFEDRAWLEGLFCQEDGMIYLSAFGQIVVETARQETLTVLVSENARKSLGKSSGKTERQLLLILQKIGDPLWRNSHIDSGWSITDLMVSKPGNVGERAAFFIRGGKVFICELYGDHSEYERHLRGRDIKDYTSASFSPYMPSEVTTQQEEPDEQLLRLLDENRELTEKNDQYKSILEAAEEKWIAENDALKKVESIVETHEIFAVKFETMKKSFWKRMSFLIHGKMR